MKKSDFLIYAHYDANGIIRKDIINFLKISSKNYKKIIFVSTKLNRKEISKFSKNTKIIIRKNVGYDFYSYKVGLNYILKKFANYYKEKIYFLNSSIIILEPRKFLRKIIKINFKKNEIWALTKSFELTEHLQSFFLIFDLKKIDINLFLNWWKKVKKYNDRWKVVRQYEIGLSMHFKENNYSLKSLFADNVKMYPDTFYKKTKQRLNNYFYKKIKIYKKSPIHYYWIKIYKNYGIIKLDLITKNQFNLDLSYLKKIRKKHNKLL